MDGDFDAFVSAWTYLTLLHNELDDSMGRRDAYPFMWSNVVIEKIEFIRDLIWRSSRST